MSREESREDTINDDATGNATNTTINPFDYHINPPSLLPYRTDQFLPDDPIVFPSDDQSSVAAASAAAASTLTATTSSSAGCHSPIEVQIVHELQVVASESVRRQVELDVTGTNPPDHGTPHPFLLRLFDQQFRSIISQQPKYQPLRPSLDNDFVKDTQLRCKMIRAVSSTTAAAAAGTTITDGHGDDSPSPKRTMLAYAAAERFCEYLSLLKEVFGSFLLERPIQLVDLTVEERQLQRRGLQQLFKYRDTVSGRRIVGCFDTHYPPDAANVTSQVRRRAAFLSFCCFFFRWFPPVAHSLLLPLLTTDSCGNVSNTNCVGRRGNTKARTCVYRYAAEGLVRYDWPNC
jgi:hypothetical protein